jgi:hypothetical protein
MSAPPPVEFTRRAITEHDLDHFGRRKSSLEASEKRRIAAGSAARATTNGVAFDDQAFIDAASDWGDQ